AILFPAVAYLELATTACHQLLSSKKDDQEQQPTIIFVDVKFVKVLILNKHELVEVFTQIIMPMREWSIILCNQDNLNKYSLNELTLHAQSKTEIDSKQQKSLTIPDRWTTQDITSVYQYGSSFQKKIKTLRGTSTTILSQLSNDTNNCSSYSLLHPYLLLLPGVGTTFLPVHIQKFIYSNKTKTKMNQSTNVEVRGKYHDNICVQGIQSGRWSMEQIIYDKLNLTTDLPNTDHKTYLDTIIKDYLTWHSTQLCLIQLIERFPRLKPFLIILNKYGLHLKDILSEEKNGLDIFLGDDEIEQTFQQIKTLLSATKIQQIFHSICQHLQLQYEQTKDNSFENYRLRIFWLTDNDYETIDLYDSKTFEKIRIESFDIIFSSNQLQGNQDLTNCLIDLRRLLVPNGLLLLLELVHIPLYFDLLFGFIDQWWSSSDDNNRALNNIQQWTTLLEQIEGFSIIEST
ncbi:unnamed protein product, partial [Adineta steineri]